MKKIFLQIKSDILCDLYINNEFNTTINNHPTTVCITQGDYFFQFKGRYHQDCVIEKIISLSTDQNIEIRFCTLLADNPHWCCDNNIEYDEKTNTYKSKHTKKTVIDFGEEYKTNGEFLNGFCYIFKSQKMGVAYKFGHILVPCEYDYIVEDYLKELLLVNKNGLWGLLKIEDGSEVVPCIYENTRFFNDTCLAVCKEGLWGLLNIENRTEIVNCAYDEVDYFNDKYIAVQTNKKWSLLSADGSFIGKNLYDEIHYYSERVPLVERHGRLEYIYEFFNRIKQNIPKKNKKEIDYIPIAGVKRDNKWGFINEDGIEVIPCIYDTVACEGCYFKVYKDGKVGGIRTDGKVIAPCLYDEILSNRVRIGNKWGLATGCNEGIIQCIYDEIINTYDGFFILSQDGKYGLIESNYNEILPCIYDKIDVVPQCKITISTPYDDWAGSCVDGANKVKDDDLIKFRKHIYFKRDSKWGFIDYDNDIYVPYVCDNVYLGEDIYAINELFAKFCQNNKWGIMTYEERKVIVPCIYDKIDMHSFLREYYIQMLYDEEEFQTILTSEGKFRI